jgi:capsular polysaccharide transport system ATP-binding protein
MTIELRNVTKKVRLGPVRLTCEDLNIVVPTGINMAFLGHEEAGLEALVGLICGADAPDQGKVRRDESISWPIPSSSYLSKHLSIAANARFLARLYETDEAAYINRVIELAQIGDWVDTKLEACPSEVRSAMTFMMGVALPFDRYIFTRLNAGGRDKRGRVDEVVGELAERANLLLVGSDTKGAQQFCQQAYVFDNGHATHYDDMEAALEHFGSIVSKNVDDDLMGGDAELEDMVGQDFI